MQNPRGYVGHFVRQSVGGSISSQPLVVAEDISCGRARRQGDPLSSSKGSHTASGRGIGHRPRSRSTSKVAEEGAGIPPASRGSATSVGNHGQTNGRRGSTDEQAEGFDGRKLKFPTSFRARRGIEDSATSTPTPPPPPQSVKSRGQAPAWASLRSTSWVTRRNQTPRRSLPSKGGCWSTGSRPAQDSISDVGPAPVSTQKHLPTG